MRLIAWVFLSRLADLSTTYFGIWRGAKELNPIGRAVLGHPVWAVLLELVAVPLYLALIAYGIQVVPIPDRGGLTGEQRREQLFQRSNRIIRIFIVVGFVVAAWNFAQGFTDWGFTH